MTSCSYQHTKQKQHLEQKARPSKKQKENLDKGFPLHNQKDIQRHAFALQDIFRNAQQKSSPRAEQDKHKEETQQAPQEQRQRPQPTKKKERIQVQKEPPQTKSFQQNPERESKESKQ